MRRPSSDQAIKILKELPVEKAFYYYSEIGSPTGVCARSLGQFLDSMKEIETSSLEFHMSRGDFEKWVLMLGDETLSQQITKLGQGDLHGEPLRRRLLQLLRLRYGLLRKLALIPTS